LNYSHGGHNAHKEKNRIENSYSDYSGIASGMNNVIGPNYSSPYSFIGGGRTNIVDNDYSVIAGGGWNNISYGHFSTIAGGQRNISFEKGTTIIWDVEKITDDIDGTK